MAPGLEGLYCNVTEGINIKEKKKQREKSWYKRKDDKRP